MDTHAALSIIHLLHVEGGGGSEEREGVGRKRELSPSTSQSEGKRKKDG